MAKPPVSFPTLVFFVKIGPHFVTHLKRPVQDGFLNKTQACKIFIHLFVKFFQNARDDAAYRGFNFAKILFHGLNAFGITNAGAA